MSTLIYVETTIPSFYSETRTAINIQARRQWTREWWAKPKPDQQLVTSAIVFEELEKIPDVARREESLALIRPLEELEYTREVAEIAEVYLRHKLMPAEALATPTILRSPHFTIAICWSHGIASIWPTRTRPVTSTASMRCSVCARHSW